MAGCNIYLISTLLMTMRMTRYFLVAMVVWMPCLIRAQVPLRLSELLYQPRSGEAEYLELYNAGSIPVDLSDYIVIRWIGDSLGKHYTLPQHEVAPHDYVVLTKDAASVTANYTVKFAGKLVQCDLPPFPNDGGSVVLATKDSSVVEKFDYLPSMHSRLLRNKAGVALERRNFESDCNAPGNWFSAASTAGYGTPTYENSQSNELLAEETHFELSSSLVSPDGDGYEDELIVSYSLDDNDIYARMLVYDARGNQVCLLLDGGLLGSQGEVRWDGRGNGNTRLLQGRYVLFINLYDLHGTKQTIKRVISIVY